MPLRVKDAFDRSWWERVSGNAASSLTELPVDLSDGGMLNMVSSGESLSN